MQKRALSPLLVPLLLSIAADALMPGYAENLHGKIRGFLRI